MAKAVQEELDAMVPGAASDTEPTIAAIAARGLPAREEVAHLTRPGLLAP